MEYEKLVSVIVPAFNTVNYIEKCIESILCQTYKDIEIIIIDDGSTDGTMKLCDSLKQKDKRIRFFHQSNQGVVSARNFGIEKARGKYISFVDSDDWIEENMIERMIQLIGNSDIVTTGVFYERSEEETFPMFDRYISGIYGVDSGIENIYSSMLFREKDRSIHAISPWMWNKLYKADLVRKVYKYIDTSIKFAEDTVFVYMYLLNCKNIVISHECFYHYCFRNDSAINKVNTNIIKDICIVYELLKEVFEQSNREFDLLFQLQGWFSFRIREAINVNLGFDKRVYMPKYAIDFCDLYNKRIVLYGAGKVGQDLYYQMNKLKIDVVSWLDLSFMKYQKRGLDVFYPSKILKIDYDIVLIAIEDKKIMEEIRKNLISLGVSEEKICWKFPCEIIY